MRWHNGAKSAFALGFDMDGDTIWRNKTRCLPNGDSYIKGPSIGQYGTKKGALRVLEILEEFSLKSTWFIPANIVMEHPDVVEKILDLGHEIGHHGLDHTGEYGATFEEQRERIERCQEIFLKYTGRRAVGFRPRARCFRRRSGGSTRRAVLCTPAPESAARHAAGTRWRGSPPMR